mgnify:FL=1
MDLSPPEWLLVYRPAALCFLFGVLFMLWAIVFILGKPIMPWMKRMPYTREDAIISRGNDVVYERSSQIPSYKVVGWILMLVAFICFIAGLHYVRGIQTL